MRAASRRHYGSPESLQIHEVAIPRPGSREVLVRVDAAGIDRGVWHVVTGLPAVVRLAGFGLRRPKQHIPGADIAGIVVAVGSSVTRFSPGDVVFGFASGAFAEFAVADHELLVDVPPGVSMASAAAIPTSGLAAIQAVRNVGRARPGQRVLVLGASGGVGSFAVQIAKHVDAHVTGVSSRNKFELLRRLGADQLIDYATHDPLADRRSYDLIVDTGGRNSIRRLRQALTLEGTLVIVGGEGGNRVTGGTGRQLRAIALSPFVSQRMTSLISKPNRDDLLALAELITVGAIEVPVARQYSLDEVALALDHLTSGEVSGKATIRIAQR